MFAMTELEREESLVDRTAIKPYHPIVVKELASGMYPKLAKFIPGFVYRYITKLLHLDHLNSFFERTHYGTGQQFLDATKEELNVELKLQGPGVEEMKNLTDKPVMFASNHPYGGPEGIVAFSYIHRLFPRARILVQSLFKIIRPFSEVCVYNKKEVRSLYNAAEEKRPLFFYPAGYCSRQLSFGDVFDYEWKPGFIKFAKKNNMPIIVFYTDGRLSKRTLNWTQFRKRFHIKASIETIFLPDEMFRLTGKTITMTAGHVIDPEVLDNSVSDKEWAARLRQYCYELKTNPDAVFDPSKPAVLPLS